ncbi:hypothetical protein KIPB_001770, partial [Kipferlia bialata]|eukprot:g1770.t1
MGLPSAPPPSIPRRLRVAPTPPVSPHPYTRPSRPASTPTTPLSKAHGSGAYERLWDPKADMDYGSPFECSPGPMLPTIRAATMLARLGSQDASADWEDLYNPQTGRGSHTHSTAPVVPLSLTETVRDMHASVTRHRKGGGGCGVEEYGEDALQEANELRVVLSPEEVAGVERAAVFRECLSPPVLRAGCMPTLLDPVNSAASQCMSITHHSRVQASHTRGRRPPPAVPAPIHRPLLCATRPQEWVEGTQTLADRRRRDRQAEQEERIRDKEGDAERAKLFNFLDNHSSAASGLLAQMDPALVE